jgi:extracellular elastinolytic metalloproteinase
MSIHRTKHLFLAAALCLPVLAMAQGSRNAREVALDFLRNNPSQFELSASDVADLGVIREYTSKHNGVTHVWVQQQLAGIPVAGGLFGLHIQSNGKVNHLGHDFVNDLARRANTTMPALGAARALELGMGHLGFGGFAVPSVREKTNERNWTFEPGLISKSAIPVRSCYHVAKGGKVRLAWELLVEQVNTPDLWTLRVDAITGEVLYKHNHTLYCKAGHPHKLEAESAHCDTKTAQKAKLTESKATVVADGSYNVFALPVESPAHGNRSIVTNPADAQASPFGWHDVNGVTGAEYTYTRGNNVWAFDDAASDDTPAVSESADGGVNLIFDFPYDANAEPEGNRNAAITNLFYVCNMMHDITFAHGFDEESGNFQTKNYSGLPGGGDAVLAQALDGGGENNANFSTPSDGTPGRMQMFKWTRVGGRNVTVNAPAAVIGQYFAGTSNWGAPITAVGVTAEVVFTDDGSGDPTYGCFPPVFDVAGKIVMVDRGECQFGEKALVVQEAGGVGCIICDHENPPLTGFGAGAVGGSVTIPAVHMKKGDCDVLRQYAGNGLNISLKTPPDGGGPDRLDGDFDNGIIAHEYGHGISNRMTGDGFSCLGNAEQMGEGWSDFFSLVTTVEPGDQGPKRQGVGTYVFRQGTDGTGIRRYPYSTDMGISPVTYGTVSENTGVHAVGEVWTAMLWDLYWAMVEKYGYDADINNTNSGNFRAVQLVMDGMTLQPCSPGFVSGRDAIVLADVINYAAADTCLISTVFARRGVGYLASEGDANDATDGVENFDPIPTCIKELKIAKSTSTPTLDPGQVAEFSIKVTNHKDETLTNVVVNDPLPAGLTLVEASNGGTLVNNAVNFNISSLLSGQVVTVTYKAKTDPNQGSVRIYQDNMDTDTDWFSGNVKDAPNTDFFVLQNANVQIGAQSWYAQGFATEKNIFLQNFSKFPISGTRPTLRFWHEYQTEKSADAGFVELTDANATNALWKRVGNADGIRNGYTGKVQYGTLAIPGLYGYSGNSNGWVQSYFDLSTFNGQEALIRFRYGSDDNTVVANGGWYVDQFEIIDLVNYDSEACVTADGGNQACAKAPESGVIMNPALVNTDDLLTKAGIETSVRPNPASDIVFLGTNSDIDGNIVVSLVSADGRTVLREQHTGGVAAGTTIPVQVGQLTAGIYMLRIETAKGVALHKVSVD